MFRTIVSTIPRDNDYPARQFTIDVYTRVLEGGLYDHLQYGFHQEENDAGEYVPVRSRRPSVRYNLCGLVVDDSTSLLFTDGHFPTIQCADEPTRDGLKKLVASTSLNSIMLEAARTGSVGSVAIQLRVLKQKDGSYRAFFSIFNTQFLEPFYSPQNPEELERIEERYKVKGSVLKDMGYAIDDDDLVKNFWFGRDWDDTAETWFIPWLPEDEKKPGFAKAIDEQKTVRHELGFVPWVWIRNLPGKLKLIGPDQAHSDVDGASTFSAAIDTMIEIEYQLSQSGRGLKYSMDPTLVMKEPANTTGFTKTPSQALVLDPSGDAKMLEIGGTAFTVVLEYVRALRELGLENIHGNRAEASKLSAAQSGRAMELMNQALIWLADKLRVQYGEGAFLSLLRMVRAANAKFPISVDGKPLGDLNAAEEITLKWPPWHAPTNSDLQSEAGTLSSLTNNALMSKETAVNIVSATYDIADPKKELARINADIAEAARVAAEQAAQVKAAETLPV